MVLHVNHFLHERAGPPNQKVVNALHERSGSPMKTISKFFEKAIYFGITDICKKMMGGDQYSSEKYTAESTPELL